MTPRPISEVKFPPQLDSLIIEHLNLWEIQGLLEEYQKQPKQDEKKAKGEISTLPLFEQATDSIPAIVPLLEKHLSAAVDARIELLKLFPHSEESKPEIPKPNKYNYPLSQECYAKMMAHIPQGFAVRILNLKEEDEWFEIVSGFNDRQLFILIDIIYEVETDLRKIVSAWRTTSRLTLCHLQNERNPQVLESYLRYVSFSSLLSRQTLEIHSEILYALIRRKEVINYLLGQKYPSYSDEGRNLFRAIITLNDLETFKQLLDDYPELLNKDKYAYLIGDLICCSDNFNFLQLAVERGLPADVRANTKRSEHLMQHSVSVIQYAAEQFVSPPPSADTETKLKIEKIFFALLDQVKKRDSFNYNNNIREWMEHLVENYPDALLEKIKTNPWMLKVRSQNQFGATNSLLLIALGQKKHDLAMKLISLGAPLDDLQDKERFKYFINFTEKFSVYALFDFYLKYLKEHQQELQEKYPALYQILDNLMTCTRAPHFLLHLEHCIEVFPELLHRQETRERALISATENAPRAAIFMLEMIEDEENQLSAKEGETLLKILINAPHKKPEHVQLAEVLIHAGADLPKNFHVSDWDNDFKVLNHIVTLREDGFEWLQRETSLPSVLNNAAKTRDVNFVTTLVACGAEFKEMPESIHPNCRKLLGVLQDLSELRNQFEEIAKENPAELNSNIITFLTRDSLSSEEKTIVEKINTDFKKVGNQTKKTLHKALDQLLALNKDQEKKDTPLFFQTSSKTTLFQKVIVVQQFLYQRKSLYELQHKSVKSPCAVSS